MKKLLLNALLCFLALPAGAAVRVYVEDLNGKAWIKYQCTGGETVQAFALDVTVNSGRILKVSDYFRGQSTAATRGYGIFPAAFRDQIVVPAGANIDWNVSGYSPLAVVADRPGDTKPGLDSAGVTLEFGALWDANTPAAAPGPEGTLCALELSEPAVVSIAANQARGGLVSSVPELIISPVFESAYVNPVPAIQGITLHEGIMTIKFKNGELEASSVLGTAWTSTGNQSGTYSEAVGTNIARFFRVRRN